MAESCGIEEFVMSLSKGRLVLQLPSTISIEDCADIKEWFQIILRRIDRIEQRLDPQ